MFTVLGEVNNPASVVVESCVGWVEERATKPNMGVVGTLRALGPCVGWVEARSDEAQRGGVFVGLRGAQPNLP